MNPLVSKALEIAKNEIGVEEAPPGSNRGRRIEQYQAVVGIAPGDPWCAAFVGWCIHAAEQALGGPSRWLMSGGCAVLNGWADEKGILETFPQAGDVFLLYGIPHGELRRRACHTGFVSSVVGGDFHTIEGNTNLDGSREGIGVFARTRRRDTNRYRYIRWADLVPAGTESAAGGYTLTLNGRQLLELPVRDGRAWCPARAWGAALGLEVGWNNEDQMITLQGSEVAAPVRLEDGHALLPVRDLAHFCGLRLEVDDAARRVTVRRV